MGSGYGTLCLDSTDRELCTAVHDRDQAAFLCALAGKPELALYQRTYEGPGFREY